MSYSKKDFEVVIPTRGQNMTGVLAGLLQHAPFNLRIVTRRWPVLHQDRYLLDTLSELGCKIIVEKQNPETLGQSHFQAAQSAYPVVVNLDDDAVVLPNGGLEKLAYEATRNQWVLPVIRFAKNLTENNIPGHTEIWDRVDRADPRVQQALRDVHPDWLRVFDIGENVPTKWLGGTCFAIRTDSYKSVADKIQQMTWGGCDAVIGLLLGRGLVLHDVYAYHYGNYSHEKWGLHKVTMKMLEVDLESMMEASYEVSK